MPIAKLNKSILKVSGSNVKELLNGIITQDIEQAKPEQPIYTLFLNNKGRVLYSTIIYMLDEASYALEIEPELLMDLAKHIHKHDISKTIEFNRLEDMCIAVTDLPTKDFYADPRSENLPFRGITKDNFTSDEKFLEIYETERLKNIIPENYDFIREKTLANDLNIEELNGVSFTKGCYLGQELTSRTKHIRESKNQLVCLENKTNISQNNLELIDSEGNKLGQTFSHNSKFVLAIIKRGTISKVT